MFPVSKLSTIPHIHQFVKCAYYSHNRALGAIFHPRHERHVPIVKSPMNAGRAGSRLRFTLPCEVWLTAVLSGRYSYNRIHKFRPSSISARIAGISLASQT